MQRLRFPIARNGILLANVAAMQAGKIHLSLLAWSGAEQRLASVAKWAGLISLGSLLSLTNEEMLAWEGKGTVNTLL